MSTPELVFVTGPNAVGKSSFIRSRLAQLENFEILMTDVYKGRIFDLFDKAVQQKRNIILETVFNDPQFSKLVDKAKLQGYFTHLVQLFLESPNDSLERTIQRRIYENGLAIPKDTVLINFNENFRNFSQYYFYFDRTDVLFNGSLNETINLMTFSGMNLDRYQSNGFSYIEKFARFAYRNDRMDESVFRIILENKNYSNTVDYKTDNQSRRQFKI